MKYRGNTIHHLVFVFVHYLSYHSSNRKDQFTGTVPGGRGVLPYKGLMGTCGQPGYVFRDFCLKQGIDFINFCLKKVSFLRQEPITLFLDDKEPALMFYECRKLGIKNRNSVLNMEGKSAVFVLNRVRV